MITVGEKPFQCTYGHVWTFSFGFIGFHSAPDPHGRKHQCLILMYHKTMLQFRCCGADSYTDWSTSVGWENHDAVPDSCCKVKSDGCGQDMEKVHQKVSWEISLNFICSLSCKQMIRVSHNCALLLRVASGLSSYFCWKTWCGSEPSALLLGSAR